MRRHLIITAIFGLLATTAHAGSRDLTVFQDGILVEMEATSRKGVAEVTLPTGIRTGSLRVKPLGTSSSIGSVELLPVHIPEKQNRELETLTEQKLRLEDRMKALETKETIFAAAAKSQSSKAPRKTKTNPDPMASVRQGTEFAIAQLEAVFTARRRTEQELKRVTARLTNLQKQAASGPTVRAETTGRIRVSAVLADGGWHPTYELRLTDTATAHLTMTAVPHDLPDGFPVTVQSGTLAQPGQPGTGKKIGEWNLPVIEQQFKNGVIPSFTIMATNTSGQKLSAGNIAIYRNGEYLGSTPLTGVDPGARFQLSK